MEAVQPVIGPFIENVCQPLPPNYLLGAPQRSPIDSFAQAKLSPYQVFPGCRDEPDLVCYRQKCQGINTPGPPHLRKGGSWCRKIPASWPPVEAILRCAAWSLQSPGGWNASCPQWCRQVNAACVGASLSCLMSLPHRQETEIPAVTLTERTEYKASSTESYKEIFTA